MLCAHCAPEPTPSPSPEGSNTGWPVPLLGGVGGGLVGARFMVWGALKRLRSLFGGVYSDFPCACCCTQHVRENSRNHIGVAVMLAHQRNVVPQWRDNVRLWDGAPMGLINVQTPHTGETPVPLPSEDQTPTSCHRGATDSQPTAILSAPSPLRTQASRIFL